MSGDEINSTTGLPVLLSINASRSLQSYFSASECVMEPYSLNPDKVTGINALETKKHLSYFQYVF
jgi:endoglucanase Acf2